MTTTILLIRHGQTDWNLQGRMQGHEDIPLNETGRQQAQALANRLADWPIQAIYSSDLQRSSETAVTIGQPHGIQPVQLPEWRERDLGSLSGLTRQEAHTKFANSVSLHNRTLVRPPNGEDHETLQKRGLAAFSDIAAKHPGDMVVVVSHGGLLHVLVAHLIGLPENEYGRFTMRGNTGLTIVEQHGDEPVVTCINDTSHLGKTKRSLALNLTSFNQFTQQLVKNLENNPHVLGLVAAGSMANQDYQPDEWSDHDFFVIVVPGSQPQFKADLSWLPQSDEIVLAFAETAHGMKVMYRFGHLLEFAIFTPDEVQEAKVNRYAILIDKGEFASLFARLREETAVSIQTNPPSDHSLYGQFLTNLFVGVGRYARGEKISGRIFINTYALGHLLKLLVRHDSADEKGLLDNLDPYRRFERVYPEVGNQLNKALNLPPPLTALELLGISETQLAEKIPHFPNEAVSILKTYIQPYI